MPLPKQMPPSLLREISSLVLASHRFLCFILFFIRPTMVNENGECKAFNLKCGRTFFNSQQFVYHYLKFLFMTERGLPPPPHTLVELSFTDRGVEGALVRDFMVEQSSELIFSQFSFYEQRKVRHDRMTTGLIFAKKLYLSCFVCTTSTKKKANAFRVSLCTWMS